MRIMRKFMLILLCLQIAFNLYAPEKLEPVEPYYCPFEAPTWIIEHESALQLLRILDLAVTLTDYQARNGMTFCNVLARDVLDSRQHDYWGDAYGFRIDAYRYDISSVFPTAFSILAINIKQAWTLADKAWKFGRIKRLSIEQAQEAANKGRVVWVVSAQWNHEAIVCPGEYSHDMGCMIAQAGGIACNGKMYLYDPRAFGWRRGDIRFYEFPVRKV